MTQKTSNFMCLTATLIALGGCDAAKDIADEALEAAGVNVDVVGTLSVAGDAPESRSVALYAPSDNPDAFDTSVCPDVEGVPDPSCFGRINVAELNSPIATGLEVEWDGDNFRVLDAPLSSDLGFIAVLGGSGGVSCTTDVVGYDSDTKLVTLSTVVTIDFDPTDPTSTDITEFALPRDANIACEAPPEEPEPPEPEVIAPPEEPPPEVEEEVIDEESGDIVGTGEGWTTFQIADGSDVADASEGDVASADNPVSCGADGIAPVLSLTAETSEDIPVAYLRLQFGSGDDATFRTDVLKVEDGRIDGWEISLPGGYAVAQLDTNDSLDAVGESYTITFCEEADLPAQEIWVNTTWDKDDTDIDTHVTAFGSEVAWYSTTQDWGSLDIDVINGFGPENVKSNADAEGGEYEVKIKYYSDHGNGSTATTVRVVYLDPSGDVCDITATETMENSGDWWTVGFFGPGMDCPE